MGKVRLEEPLPIIMALINFPTKHNRLDAQNKVLVQAMGNKPFQAPHSPNFSKISKKILDIGCGTGILTVQLACMFPSAHVIGVDLSPVPLDRHGRPQNVTYLVGSAADLLRRGELELESFDYVFSRLLVLGVVDWPAHVRRVVMRLLAPGGCVDIQEYDSMVRAGGPGEAAGGRYGDELGGRWEWFRFWMGNNEALGMDLRAGLHLRQLVADAGGEGIEESVYDIPHAGLAATHGTTGVSWANTAETMWGAVVKSSGSGHPPDVLRKMRRNYEDTFIAGIENLMFRFHVVVGYKSKSI